MQIDFRPGLSGGITARSIIGNPLSISQCNIWLGPNIHSRGRIVADEFVRTIAKGNPSEGHKFG